MIEVVCAFLLKDGKVWMGKRPASKHNGLKWEFPGGKVMRSESHEQALIRELYEELQVDVVVHEKWGMIEFTYPEKTIALHGYLVTSEDLPKCTEHIEERWIALDHSDFEGWSQADIALWKSMTK